MVLSNETVLIEQYQTTEALVRAGGVPPEAEPCPAF